MLDSFNMTILTGVSWYLEVVLIFIFLIVRNIEHLFMCHIYMFILPFHTVHGVLKVRILKWFAIPFSSGPHSVSKFGKLSSGHRTGKGQFSFQSQRKAMPKNAQTTTQMRGNPACRGTFGGRRKAVRDRLALQGGTGDFP